MEYPGLFDVTRSGILPRGIGIRNRNFFSGAKIMAVKTITDVFTQTPSSADKTAILAAYTTLLAALDTAVTNGKLGTVARDQLHDQMVTQAQDVATNLKA